MRTLDQIWQEYIDNDEILPKDALKDLIWHIEHDELPIEAIILATDMRLYKLGSTMAKYLDHEDDCVRRVTVGSLIGRLFLDEYAEKAFDMVVNDFDGGVQNVAISGLGTVLDQVDNKLQKKIASYIHTVIVSPEYDKLDKQAAYSSIVKAMDISPEEWPGVKSDPDLSKMIDQDLVEQFKKKYHI